MKITTLLLLSTILNVFITANQSEISKKFISKTISSIIKHNNLGPNVQDIKLMYKQTVSPYYEKPYLPQEVDKLAEESNNIKKDLTKFMTKAEIIGPIQQKGEEVKKYFLKKNPIMYNTVIESHQTTITHPVAKPEKMILNNGGGEALFDENGDYNNLPSEKGYENVMQGSIPVKINNNFNKNAFDGNFEDPVFIHKNEKVKENVESLKSVLNNQVNNDISIIKAKLKGADSKEEKIKVCKIFFYFSEKRHEKTQ